MAKPAPADEDAAALRRRLRRSLAAVAAGGAAADVYDEAAAALEALREAELGTGGRKGGGGGEGRRTAAEGVEEKEVVPVPPQFLCPISSRIMSDPVIVASGQVRSQLRFFTGFGSVLGEFWCAIAVENHILPTIVFLVGCLPLFYRVASLVDFC